MKDNITIRVTCPHCGRTMHIKRKISFREYLDEWDRLLSDFDMEEFHCSCGQDFLGAETAQSEKLEKITSMLEDLKSQGKFEITGDGMRIHLGFSDIWKIIKEFKDLEGVFE
ncbi:MAG: hypothetical protein HXS53_03740 [Theionarchaea archaeon]|nr:hypothetical protein [Theionarchaea archaeon]